MGAAASTVSESVQHALGVEDKDKPLVCALVHAYMCASMQHASTCVNVCARVCVLVGAARVCTNSHDECEHMQASIRPLLMLHTLLRSQFPTANGEAHQPYDQSKGGQKGE